MYQYVTLIHILKYYIVYYLHYYAFYARAKINVCYLRTYTICDVQRTCLMCLSDSERLKI